jgi:SAM-dependent methyltransferase
MSSSSSPWLKKSPSDEVPKSLAASVDIYQCYEVSVQSPQKEIRNLIKMYSEVATPPHTTTNMMDGDEPLDELMCATRCPRLLREDFCGTALLCKHWLDHNIENSAIGIDIDPETIKYALQTRFEDNKRIRLITGDVRRVTELPLVDLLVALNYSVGYFHSYHDLLGYFCKVKKEIKRGGLFVCDIFGGSDYFLGSSVTVRKYPPFKYTFEQSQISMLTNRVQCAIHFKFDDGK